MATIDDLNTQVAGLSTNVADLLAAVNVQKSYIDGAESLAAGQVVLATAQANAAAASFDSFDDRYLGAKATAPTLDNDGNALLIGAIYFNNIANTWNAWNGTDWITAPINNASGVVNTPSGNIAAINVQAAINELDTEKQAVAQKDASGGYAGLSAYKITFKNASGTQPSYLTHSNTATRNYTFPDKDITVAGMDDVIAAVTGLYDDRGNYDASGNTYPTTGGSGTAGAILKGDIWTISVAGTLGGNRIDIGQTLRALVDSPAQVSSNWANGGSIGLDDSITDAITTRAPSQNAVYDALLLKQDANKKDASNGFAGLTLLKLNLKNAANTFTNFLSNTTTAARNWVMPDKDGTVALLSDITGAGNLTYNPVIVATAGQTVFNVASGYSNNLLMVFLNGYKLPASEYTAVNGTSITLNTACAAGEEIETAVFSNQAMGALSSIVRTQAVATDNQTTFPVTYPVGMILVKTRGEILPPSDYTATNGTSVVFNTGLATGTEVEFIVFSTITLANAVPSTGGTMSGDLQVAANVLVTSPTAGVGYGTGSGGTVTQATSKTTPVTLNKPTGQITLNAAALAAGTVATFALNNSTIATSDLVYVQLDWGNGGAAYNVWVGLTVAGQCYINIKNISAGSLSEAVVVRFAVIKGAIA